MRGSLRILLAAVGWTGHAFPIFALGRELRARGHRVAVETFERWRETVEGLGLSFWPAPEMMTFPGVATGPDGATLADAARGMADRLADLRPDVVVSDLFTIAPMLAAERVGVRAATVIPHPFPVHEPGLPFYPLGLLPPRTPVGRLAWRTLWPVIGTRLPNTRLRRVRAELDATRAELGLGRQRGYDGQISAGLAIVATFPQLEYARRWPGHVHVTGPMSFEVPHPEIQLPEGEQPMVLVASSTERDPDLRLVRVALEALEGEPARVLATTNRRGLRWAEAAPANATVVDWVSYAQAMPRASLVVSHGGHGTVTRSLAEGVPVLICPPAGDMAETGARVTWSGAGLMIPNRLLGAAALRATARALLGDPRFARKAASIAQWARANDGVAAGADLVERYARG